MLRRHLSKMSVFVLLFVLIGSISQFTVFSQGRGLARAMEVQNGNTPGLMNNPNIVGTAVTLDQNGEPAILLMLKHGNGAGLPTEIEGFVVVTEVVGEIVALCHKGKPHGRQNNCGGKEPPPPPSGGNNCLTDSNINRTARYRPACIGISSGHPSITAGTIGARVKVGGNTYALSNNHVFAASNGASVGDAVIQPGTYDGGSNPADNLGTLAQYVPIKFDGSCNYIDAAIASVDPSVLSNSTPSNGYGVPSSSTVAVGNLSFDQSVEKYGRTTGYTSGRVYAINANVNVNYSVGTALFCNQIIITPGTFSSGGDSGSLVVTSSGKNPVGLLFAGSSQYTIINPIQDVLSAFGATIDGN